jgi:peptidyl-prolyl cis-trans isomerase C
MIIKTATLLSIGLFAASGAFAVNSGTNPAAKSGDVLTQLFGDPVVAKGKGVEVKRSQLDTTMISIRAAAAARRQTLSPEQGQLLERQVLQHLIATQLLVDQATDADKAKGKEIADKHFDTILKRAGSQEGLERQLKSVGMTVAALRTNITEEAIADAVLERELKVTVTDEEVKKFYDENPARFEQPEMVRASHILLSTRDPITGQPLSDEEKAAKRKQAEALLKRARSGEDFAKLAKEYSEDPGSKDNGGEYTFPRGVMDPAFEAAAFSLNTNQISDIVTTQFGYHIIKLHEKIPAHKVELAKVADKLKEALKRRELDKLMPDYIKKLEQSNHVEILDPELKPEKGSPDISVKPSPSKETNDKK